MLLIPSLFTSNLSNLDNNTNLETSTNYLFNSKNYTFNLDDFYDDTNLSKIFTGAKFQTEDFNETGWTGTIDNDTVVTVNNTEIQYGDPNNINMMDGITDSTDYMKVKDDVGTNFTSTRYLDGREIPDQWDDFTFTNGTGITIGDLETINADYSIIRADGDPNHYPATYSFENEIDGTSGTDIVFVDVAPINAISIIESDFLGHNKILHHSCTANFIQHKHLFDGGDQVFGTLEFWIVLGETDISHYLFIKSAAGGNGIRLWWSNDGNFYVTNGFVSPNVGGYVANTWYHIRIDFECDTGEYMGLGIDKYRIFVDDVEYGEYSFFNNMPLPGFGQYMWYGFVDCDMYFDAFGHTWEAYNIGDNKYPDIDLDVQVDIQVDDLDCISIESLEFSHKTNVSATIDLDIWNWDTSTWFEIESVDNFANFDDDSFALGDGSDFVSGTWNVRIRFQNITGVVVSFELQIDRLRLDYKIPNPELEMEIILPFARYNEDLLALNISCWQMTNITQLMNFSIWNYTSSAYVQISSSSDTIFAEKNYGTLSPNDFINSTGAVRLHWVGVNATSDFEYYIDYLHVKIYYKLDLEHSKAFTTNGVYRYRWCVIGSIHYTQWVTFEIVDPTPNFHAISESSYATRWILQNSSLTVVANFSDDISGANWYLTDVSERFIVTNYIPTDDTFAQEENPDDNYGDYLSVWVEYFGSGYIHTGFLKWEYPYLDLNVTTNSTLYGNGALCIDNPYAYVYHTSDFNEMTLTWNNQPATGDYQSSWTIVDGWQEYDIGAPNYYYKLIPITDYFNMAQIRASDFSNREPRLRHNFSKSYLGSGYMYMQTNTTESISLQSTDYGTHYNLSSGDYFEIDFQTSSDSQIDLILLRDGVVNKTLVLSASGNTNFDRHTVQISIDEFVEYDQLKISSTFEDPDYIRVYDIETHLYTMVGDFDDFLVGSKNDYSVYLTPDVYNLRIVDQRSGDVKVNENITIPTNGVKHYVYKPTELIQCRITLFNTEDEYLQFEDYHVIINRSLDDGYNQFELVDPLFYADVGTNVYIEVLDRFDNSINNFTKISSAYLDLELDVYQLQIKNIMEQETTLIINATNTYPLLSGDSLYFMLIEAYYVIGYTDEQGADNTFTIYLNSNQAYEINSSLKTIYFGLFTYDGLGIDHDLIRFYINDSRKDLGFNSMLGSSINVTVLDYFNNTLASEVIDTSTYDNSEYNLYVQIYSMYILNQFTYKDLIFNITQVGSGYYMNQLIPSASALLYRFIPNLNYTINATYINGTVYNIRTINLTDNSQIESFGVPDAPSEYPKDVYFGVYTTTGLGVDRDLLRFYIDGDRTDFGFNRITTENITLLVRDYFNSTLFNQEVNTSGIYEYNILITLYSLKVKNEARVSANYTLSLGALETTGVILPEEIIEYQLATNNYVFDYINNEDGSLHSISFTLDEDKVYIINSTYYDVYIALYNFYGVVNREEVKFYINNTRADFGFNTIKSEHVNLLILDFFNSTLYNQIVRLEGLTEYSVFIQAYTLVINNLYNNQSITISITRGTITVERLIEAQGWTEFKLYPNIEYEIISYVDGIKDEEKEVDLDEEYKTVDFGFYEAEVPLIPRPLEADFYIFMAFVIVIAIGCVIIVISWGYMKSSRDETPKETRLRHKRKRKAAVDRKKGFMYDHT